MKIFFRVTWLYWIPVCFLLGCTFTMVTIKNSEDVDVKPKESPLVSEVGNTELKAKLEVNVGKKDSIKK